MAVWRSCLLYGDVYDLALTMHDPIKDRNTRWTFSDENRKFAAAWKKPELDEDDRTTIKKNIRRFESIYASESKIYLIETKRDESGINLWVVDPADKSIAVFPYLELIGSREQKSSALRFDYLAGAYQNGMVFVIEDEKKFKAVQDRYPQFRDLKFGLNENPALIYIRFD